MVEIYILKSENKIDGCQSFTHVSFLIETKEKNKENCYTVDTVSSTSLTRINDDFIAQVIQTLHRCFSELCGCCMS